MKNSLIALIAIIVAATGFILFTIESAPRANHMEEPPLKTVCSPRQPVEKTVPDNINAPEVRQESVESVGTVVHSLSIDPGEPEQPQLADSLAVLISTEATLLQKQTVWEELLAKGELDEAIKALRQSAAKNPESPEFPIALGQANLQKIRAVMKRGGAMNEMGILAMQADQEFNKALKIDPANWEGQFNKAAALSHWPAELKKGEEVVQRLSTDQQEAMTQRTDFAQTYLLLGQQFQKMGKMEYAEATWRLGLEKFPADVLLQKKLNNVAP